VNALDTHLGDDRLRLVDIGARGGIAPRWERMTSVLEVTAFEPESSECERLNREAASLPYPIRYLPVGLWREPADAIPLHVTYWPVASSLRRPNAEFLRSFPEAEKLFGVQHVETIAVTTLDEVARREGVVADCLKVDVEGTALDVLIGAEATLRDTLVLEVEAELNPLFEDEALFPEVDSHLRERGWVLQGLRRTSWRRGARLDASTAGFGGQIVAVDALYWNGALIEGGLSVNQELKFLVMLSAYLQADALLARIADSGPLADGLTGAELEELKRFLNPPASRIARVGRRAFARLDSARRRALADRLQPGDATVWEDPHFF
jgi:FkbM family methyltransferase